MGDYNDSFSNPLAPPGHDAGKNNLTNEDFRKLVMTVGRDPRASSSVVAAVNATVTSKEKRPAGEGEKKKKRKQQYQKIKKEKEDREKELSNKYRDRARERRDGVNQDYEDVELLQATAEYRAVAPDAKRQEELKERRKKAIDESKYLGGDMQHTHLVKGLDYALLDKVRQEMVHKKRNEEIELEQQRQQQKKQDEEINTINSIVARNIVRAVFGSAALLAERQAAVREHFSKQRMAYVVELDDDPHSETDIPTTVMRSVAEGIASGRAGNSDGPTSSELVIEKLTEILAYLRSGKGVKKVLKKGETASIAQQYSSGQSKPLTAAPGTSGNKNSGKSGTGDSIYDDVADYVPVTTKSSSKKDDSVQRKKDSYFGKSAEKEKEAEQTKSVGDIMKSFQHEAVAYDGDADAGGLLEGQNAASNARIMKKLEQKLNVDSYAECYPGMMESMDALQDSDEEADLSKMDMGANKKGPLNRWDFETAEEFEKYKSEQEAMPRAAFQYGVKTNDGRKTRKNEGKKDDKGKMDRQWTQIQQIWERKRDKTNDHEEGDSASSAHDEKRPRY